MSESEQFKAEGNKAFSAKEFDKAIELFTKAIETSETPNHVLYSNRSASYASLRDFRKALEDAEECVKINPSWAKGYGRKGAAYYGLGDLVSAKDSYEEALKIDPSNAQAKSGLASVEDAIVREAAADGTTPDLGIGSLFKDPQNLAKLAAHPKTKEYMKDPSFLRKLSELTSSSNPMASIQSAAQDPRLMQAIGVMLGIDTESFPPRPDASGASGAAEDVSKDADNDTPIPDAVPTESKADTAEKSATENASEQPNESAESAGTAEPVEPVEPEPKDEEAALKAQAEDEKTLGNSDYKARKFDSAIEHYNKAWNLHKNITYLNNRAAAEFEKKDFDACIATCLEATEYGREVFADYKLLAKSYGRLGNAYLKKDDLVKAIEAFNKSLTEHRTPDILNRLRQAEKDLKRKEIESYIDPVKADEAREEGNKLFKESDWPGAVRAYTEAIKRSPDDARGYANRAAAYLKLMSFPEVVKDSDQAIEKDPKFFKAYSRKAHAYFAMREYKKCLDTLDIASEVDTEHKHIQEISELQSKALYARFQSQEGETPEETLERASRDPEVTSILQDPIMNSILQQAQGNPAALQDHMKNPEVRKKINTLIAAGIIKTR